MKIQITIILGIILAMSLVSALTLEAGTNHTIRVNTTEELFYTIVGNSSDMEGFNISQEIYNSYSNITFLTVINFAPDSFTVILFPNSTNEIIVPQPYYSSGGSSGTKTIYKDRNITVEKPVDKIIYQNKEVEKEVEKIVKVLANKKLVWVLGILVILIIICSYMAVRWERNKNKSFKGFENLEGGSKNGRTK